MYRGWEGKETSVELTEHHECRWYYFAILVYAATVGGLWKSWHGKPLGLPKVFVQIHQSIICC